MPSLTGIPNGGNAPCANRKITVIMKLYRYGITWILVGVLGIVNANEIVEPVLPIMKRINELILSSRISEGTRKGIQGDEKESNDRLILSIGLVRRDIIPDLVLKIENKGVEDMLVPLSEETIVFTFTDHDGQPIIVPTISHECPSREDNEEEKGREPLITVSEMTETALRSPSVGSSDAIIPSGGEKTFLIKLGPQIVSSVLAKLEIENRMKSQASARALIIVKSQKNVKDSRMFLSDVLLLTLP